MQALFLVGPSPVRQLVNGLLAVVYWYTVQSIRFRYTVKKTEFLYRQSRFCQNVIANLALLNFSVSTQL